VGRRHWSAWSESRHNQGSSSRIKAHSNPGCSTRRRQGQGRPWPAPWRASRKLSGIQGQFQRRPSSRQHQGRWQAAPAQQMPGWQAGDEHGRLPRSTGCAAAAAARLAAAEPSVRLQAVMQRGKQRRSARRGVSIQALAAHRHPHGFGSGAVACPVPRPRPARTARPLAKGSGSWERSS